MTRTPTERLEERARQQLRHRTQCAEACAAGDRDQPECVDVGCIRVGSLRQRQVPGRGRRGPEGYRGWDPKCTDLRSRGPHRAEAQSCRRGFQIVWASASGQSLIRICPGCSQVSGPNGHGRNRRTSTFSGAGIDKTIDVSTAMNRLGGIYGPERRIGTSRQAKGQGRHYTAAWTARMLQLT